jgi:CheY-like chemotaxis protein
VSSEILVVEDDRELARSLVRTLEARDYRTRQVHDGEAALKEVVRQAPDLVLLDLLLPKKDGRAILTTLQASTATQQIPVIVMTGIFRGRDHGRELLSAGAKAFLEKPFTVSELMSLLRELLGSSEEPEKPDRIQLADRPTAEVLWEVMQERFCGAVHFQSGQRHKQLILEDGEPRAVRSNIIRECLGPRLRDAGRIDERTYQESLLRSRNSERQQGETLVRMQALSAAELEQVLSEQATEKLLDLFRWREGEVWRQAGVRDVPHASQLEGWSPRLTILKGVEMMDHRQLTEALLPHRYSVVSRVEPTLSMLETTPGVAALFKALGSEPSVADLVEAHIPALYGLWLIGAVRFEEKAEPESAEVSPLLMELRALLERQGQQSHFEVLGVPEAASSEDLRQAFVGLAKRYHPDRFSGEGEETQALVSQLFANMAVAHETLTEPTSRKAYVAQLRGGKKDPGEVARIVSAEKEFRTGEALLKKRDFAPALEHFRRAFELDPTEGEFSALYGWTLFLVKEGDPISREEALQRLQEAQALAPRSATGYYYMGLFRKACGEVDQAERMFRKALEISPGHADAGRELRLHERRRREREGPGSSGLFGFGRKKK